MYLLKAFNKIVCRAKSYFTNTFFLIICNLLLINIFTSFWFKHNYVFTFNLHIYLKILIILKYSKISCGDNLYEETTSKNGQCALEQI